MLSNADGTSRGGALQNDSQPGLRDVPIALTVTDAKGKTLFKNDDPALDPP